MSILNGMQDAFAEQDMNLMVVRLADAPPRFHIPAGDTAHPLALLRFLAFNNSPPPAYN